MQRSLRSRVTAAVMAMLVCVSTPALAVAHGVTHAHLASAHGSSAAQQGDHDDASDHHHADEHESYAAPGADVLIGASLRGPELNTPAHEHEHGHLGLWNASVSRDGYRLDIGAQLIVAPRMSNTHALTLVTQFGRSTWRDRSLLARPGPATGPPTNPRAPPVR